MSLPDFLQRIIDWIREGYPEGLPEHDYIALFALLGRRLSPPELEEVGNHLVESGQPAAATGDRDAEKGEHRKAMLQAISAAGQFPAAEADIARVNARLQAVGWNLG